LFHAGLSKVTSVSRPPNSASWPPPALRDNHEVTEPLRYDPDGLRSFASACERHAEDVCVHDHPSVPSARHQSTFAAVTGLHDATAGVGDLMAARIRATASAVSTAAERYSHIEDGSADALSASVRADPV